MLSVQGTRDKVQASEKQSFHLRLSSLALPSVRHWPASPSPNPGCLMGRSTVQASDHQRYWSPLRNPELLTFAKGQPLPRTVVYPVIHPRLSCVCREAVQVQRPRYPKLVSQLAGLSHRLRSLPTLHTAQVACVAGLRSWGIFDAGNHHLPYNQEKLSNLTSCPNGSFCFLIYPTAPWMKQ